MASDNLAHISGSHRAWRIAMPLPAAMQNYHQNGGGVFLNFVADPRTVRLCTIPRSYEQRHVVIENVQVGRGEPGSSAMSPRLAGTLSDKSTSVVTVSPS
jgi:hypothetical protein